MFKSKTLTALSIGSFASIAAITLAAPTAARAQDAAASFPSKPILIVVPQTPGSVLLAEDSDDNRRLIEFYLRSMGARVDHAGDGRVAVDRATAAARPRRKDRRLRTASAV